ncbi:MAG: thioredoxin family protein [Candidatus Micrarchaeota archaeon]|nr:thioredoxin family protein [Candidatus Micrarchaeota archaeon]
MFQTEDSSALKKQIAKGKHLVLFYASWCPDCSRFMPTFDSLPGKTALPLSKAQTDEDENSIWEDYKIERVPTVVLFENGKEKARAEESGGSIDKKKLERMLK